MPPPGSTPPYFSQQTSPFSYAPPPTPLPFGLSQNDLNGMGVGGSAIQMFAPMLSEWARSQFGMFGFTFGSGFNPATTQYGREYLQQMQAARAAGAEADRGAVNDLLRGVAVMIGHRPDLEATRLAGDGRVRFDRAGEQMIARMAADTSGFLPFLATMLPDAVDAGLPGGSKTVAAGYMTTANRFMVDPATGRRLSADAGFVDRVLDPLTAAGPAATDGLKVGRVGAAYAEFARRGLIGPGDGTAARSAYDALAGVSRPDDPGAEAYVRDVSADRVRRQLGGYAKAVAAVNEIFAEQGRSNAPMAELIDALDGLTQGGLSVYRAEQLTGLARQFQGASHEFGLTLAGMAQLSTQAGAQLSALGAHRGLAAPAALYAAAAGNAYGARNFAAGAEAGGMDQQMALAMAKTTAFASSEMGNLVGALDVLTNFLGPDGKDTDLGRVVQGLRAGRTTTALGDGSTFDIRNATHAQITGLATRSGLSAESVMNQIAFGRAANQAALVDNQGYTTLLRPEVQRAEIERTFKAQHGVTLARLGFDTPERQDELFRNFYAAVNDPETTSLAQAVVRTGRAMNVRAADMADLNGLLDNIYTQYARSGGVQDVGGLAGARGVSPQAQAGTQAARARMQQRADEAQALARLNQQGMGGAISDAVVRFGRMSTIGGFMNPDGSVDFGRALAQGAFGGISAEDAARAQADFEAARRGGAQQPAEGSWLDRMLRRAREAQPAQPGAQQPAEGSWLDRMLQQLGGQRAAGQPPGGAAGTLRLSGEITINDNGIPRRGTGMFMIGEQVVPG